MEEVNIEEKKEKINFLKKIWYSISKLSKYDDLMNQGVMSSIVYYILLILMFSAIFSIALVHQTVELNDEGYAYFESMLPELKFKEGELSVESDEILRLRNELLELLVGGSIIVDTTKTSEDDFEEYVNEIGTSIGYILLSDKIVAVNLKSDEDIFGYEEFILKYFGEEVDYFTKDHILEVIEDTSVEPLLQYVIAIGVYFVSWFVIHGMYILPITVTVYLILRISKKTLPLKELLKLNIYAYTLSTILYLIYMVQGMYTKWYFIGIEYGILLISGIYVGLYFKKKKMPKIKKV